MPSRLPLLIALCAASLILSTGCTRKPTTTALDRQRLNRAWAYFLFAQADAQMHRQPYPRWTEPVARGWVLRGLRQPELKAVRETRGFSLGISEPPSLSVQWRQELAENPNKPLADTLVAVFNDTPATWNPQEHLWHLPPEYAVDYNWARNEDRFKFPLAFYQDPYPGVTN